MSEAVLRVAGISKRFGGLQAHQASEIGGGNTIGEAPRRREGLGERGEMRLTKDALAGSEKFRKFHRHEFPSFGARAPG